MECPICFKSIKNSIVCQELHHFCYNCIIKWIEHNGTSCPLCKTFFYEIKFDKEFDIINKYSIVEIYKDNICSDNIPDLSYNKCIEIFFENKNDKPGISIEKTDSFIKILDLKNISVINQV